MRIFKLHILLFAVILNLISQHGTLQFIGPFGGNITAINGNTTGDNLVVGVKNNGIFYSTNNGTSWTHSDLTIGNINSFAVNPSNSQIIFAASEIGLFKSVNGGKNWTSTNLLGKINSLSISQKNPNFILAGVYRADSTGVARSIDGGDNWVISNSGLKIEALIVSSIAIDAVKDSIVYIGTQGGGVYYSRDRGATWTEQNSNFFNLPATHPRKFVNQILLSQDASFQNSIVIGTNDGAYFSLSRGGSWISLNLGLEGSDSAVKNIGVISDNPDDPQGPNTLYMSTLPISNGININPSLGGFYSSNILTGTFQSWQAKFQQTNYVNCFFIPKNSPTTVILGTSDGVYFSNDKGKNWERRNANINFLETTKMVSTRNGDTLFISSNGGGMYRSIDAGVNWKNINSGLEDPFVSYFELDPRSSKIIYAINNLNIYKTVTAGEKWFKLQLPIVNQQYSNSSFKAKLKLSARNPNKIIMHSQRTEAQFSVDGGTNWQKLNLPSNFDPTFLHGDITFHNSNENSIVVASSGVWMSRNMGTTWMNITGNLPLTNSFGISVYGVRIATRFSNDSVIYLSRTDGYKMEKMFFTTDLNNWTSSGLEATTVLISSKNSNLILTASGKKTYLSEDKGLTWIATSTESTHVGINRINSTSNNFLFYLATSGGIYQEFYSKDPALYVTKKSFDIGSLSIGETKNIVFNFKNIGSQILNVRIDSIDNAKDFYAKKNQSIIVQPKTEGSLTIKFQPLTAGVVNATLFLTTNDPDNITLKYYLNGKGIAKAVVVKKVLIDSLHGVSTIDSLKSVPEYFSGLIKSLSESGMSVTSDQKTFDTTGFNAIIIPAPKKKYSLNEVLAIQKYVTRGGSVIMLADQNAGVGNNYLNDILNDFRWKTDFKDSTGIQIQSNSFVVDSILSFQNNPQNIIAPQFVNKSHPFLKNVDTLVLFGSTNLITQEGKSTIFLRGSSTTFSVNSTTQKTDSLRPTLIAITQVGKGNIIVIGDMDLWSEKLVYSTDTTGAMLSGLFAKSNLKFALNIFSLTQNFEVKLPQQTLNERYMLFTIPYDLNSFNISSVLKELGSVNAVNWRLWKWDSEKQNFVEFPNAAFTNFNRGEGYWLITKGEKSLNLGSATLISATGYHEVKLYPGYNLIGNPFPYTISWENSKLDSGIENKVWRWNKTRYEAVTTNLLPFEGYWVKNNTNKILTVLINPAKVSGSGKIDPGFKISNSKWEVKLRALSLFATDEDNFIGMRNDARKEKDEFDYSEPPVAPTHYLQLAFPKFDWEKSSGFYSSDIRPVSDEGDFWDFEVSSNINSIETKLAYELTGELPEDFKVMLLDKFEERIYDVKNNSYNFIFKKGETKRKFRILIGRESFILRNTEGIPLVAPNYILKQNFPNPFNPQTAIDYSLSYSGNVELKIYNSLGQEVRTLINQTQKIGTYSILWNGLDNFGRSVSAGVYFYRIKSGTFRESKKMLLIK